MCEFRPGFVRADPGSRCLARGRRAESCTRKEQVRRFDQDPRWRRGRIRDVVAAREILIEINEALSRGLAERGAILEAVFPRMEDTRHIDSMPSFDVAVTLKDGIPAGSDASMEAERHPRHRRHGFDAPPLRHRPH
jgi:hypothetical protein